MNPSKNTGKNINGMIGIALAGGLLLAGTAFAVQPLHQGYLAAATQAKAGEGKCGEGKCGSASAATKVASAEGKCGEGKCGDASFSQTDADKDGKVSRAEFLAVAAERATDFDKIDSARDGFISEAEAYEFLRATYEANGKKVPAGLFSQEAIGNP
jgi:uncharacterized low-complexity protein